MTHDAYRREFDATLAAHGIQHFRASELAHVRAGVPPCRLWPNILPTLKVCERIRAKLRVHLPDAVLIVNSGYRSPEYNKKVGGAESSLHLEFSALDIRCPQAPASVVADYARQDPDAARLGIGEYSGFVHVDSRGHIGRKAPARWEG